MIGSQKCSFAETVLFFCPWGRMPGAGCWVPGPTCRVPGSPGAGCPGERGPQKLIGLISLISPIGLMELVGLIELIGLVGLVELIGLIDLIDK